MPTAATNGIDLLKQQKREPAESNQTSPRDIESATCKMAACRTAEQSPSCTRLLGQRCLQTAVLRVLASMRFRALEGFCVPFLKGFMLLPESKLSKTAGGLSLQVAHEYDNHKTYEGVRRHRLAEAAGNS